MNHARFGFSAHPEALADLREVPDHIRDLALLELQHVVHGNERGAPLYGDLAGCQKVYVDPKAEWRMVIQFRAAPAGSLHEREIHLLAAGQREAGAAYNAARERLTRTTDAEPAPAPLGQRTEAARARSSHLRSVPAPGTSSPGPAPGHAAVQPPTARKAGM